MKDESARRTVNWFELDRLVDGQLAPQEYRELLRQVEKDPDGWRQCALAFLQHQAMEKELRAFSNSPESPLDRPAKPVATPPIYVRQLSRSMTVICGVSLALVLGISAGVSMRPVGDSIDLQGGGEIASVSQGSVSTIDPNRNYRVLGFERSSFAPVAPAPNRSSHSWSSNSLHDVCADVVEQDDPHLSGGCSRARNQFK